MAQVIQELVTRFTLESNYDVQPKKSTFEWRMKLGNKLIELAAWITKTKITIGVKIDTEER
jgi:hypothetical protein